MMTDMACFKPDLTPSKFMENYLSLPRCVDSDPVALGRQVMLLAILLGYSLRTV